MKYPGVTVKILRRAKRIRTDYGFDADKKKWHGPVERRDPAHYQQRSIVAIRPCGNVWCRLWISTDAPRCPHCHERQ